MSIDNHQNYAKSNLEKLQMIKILENQQIKLSDAAGFAVAIELRMRLIAESCEPLRQRVDELNKKKDRGYWNCDLQYLDTAIDEIFGEKLTDAERWQLKNFRPLRNSLIHGNFVELTQRMDGELKGQQIFQNGDRNIVMELNITEAIKSLGRNQILENFIKLACEVINILDKLITEL